MKNCKLYIIKNDIEDMRSKINNLAEEKEELDKEVINLSQKLDKMMNKYNKIKYKKYS